MKYILSQNKEAIIFSDSLNHDDVCRSLRFKPLSAGFVFLHEGEIKTKGESFTLNLKSRLEDAQILKIKLSLYGI